MKLDRELFERAAKAFREGDEVTLREIASRNVKERARVAASRARQPLSELPGPHAASTEGRSCNPKVSETGNFEGSGEAEPS